MKALSMAAVAGSQIRGSGDCEAIAKRQKLASMDPCGPKDAKTSGADKVDASPAQELQPRLLQKKGRSPPPANLSGGTAHVTPVHTHGKD
jgi:hypothetical protein